MLGALLRRGSNNAQAVSTEGVSEPSLHQSAVNQGRRRATIAVVPEMSDGKRLSQADVEQLRADPSAEVRALVARKLGDQADDLVEQGHTKLVAAILGLLVKDVEMEVRRSLAEAMASSPNLPVSAAQQLARDQIEIARPILQSSPVLRDDDLIEIVRTSAMQYSLAIAARGRIGEQLSKALVETGHQPVVARLLDNQKARISESTLERVVEDFGQDSEVQQRLVRRMELPGELLERLTHSIGSSIQATLQEHCGVDDQTASRLIKTATQNAAIKRVARDHDDETLKRHLRCRFEEGTLEQEDVLKFLEEGDIAAFEIAIAILATIPVKQARAMLYHTDRRYLMGVCAAANFAPLHFINLFSAMNIAEDALATSGRQNSYSSEALRDLHASYEVLLQDPEAVAELLDSSS